MDVSLAPAYRLPMVALSYGIAVLGSLVAMTAGRRIMGRSGRLNYYNVATAGIALGGIGIWSMHFVGMLALHLDAGVAYSIAETLISLVAAIVAASAALGYVAEAPQRLGRIAAAGTMLGLGVAAMHYLGMHGLRFGGFIRWSLGLVAASIAIAVAAASVALWLAFNIKTWTVRILSAALMGLAICAMHYTGMAAAEFICTAPDRQMVPDGFGLVSALHLPLWVTVLASSVALGLGFDQLTRPLGDPDGA